MDWENANILVTGGTGSFGKRFIRYILDNYNPERVIVFSRDEYKQYKMERAYDDERLRFFLGDVRDLERLELAFSRIDLVVHAAALKQVPACEYNPFEAILTNVIGAKNIITAAVRNNVKKVMAISTDKAVNPVNLYGTTKLCAEKLFVQGNAYAGHRVKFSCVRYGNVIGSRGSVIPLFLSQKESGVLTITDPRMTRFWITLDKGVAFVSNCIDIMQGSEVFIPKIPSMKLTDLAEAVAPGCRHEIIGIRPGEKLHEVLVTDDDARNTLEFDDSFQILPKSKFDRMVEQNLGTQVPVGFRYTSDNNTEWLDGEQLKAMIKDM